MSTPPPDAFLLPDNMTERQIISAVGGLAIIAIHAYKECLPTKQQAGNEIRKVERAIHSMFKETGQAIDDEIVDHVVGAWNMAMKLLTTGSGG
jgi:hypothetical protein